MYMNVITKKYVEAFSCILSCYTFSKISSHTFSICLHTYMIITLASTTLYSFDILICINNNLYYKRITCTMCYMFMPSPFRAGCSLGKTPKRCHPLTQQQGQDLKQKVSSSPNPTTRSRFEAEGITMILFVMKTNSSNADVQHNGCGGLGIDPFLHPIQ